MKIRYGLIIMCVVLVTSVSARPFKFKSMDGETLTDDRTGLVWLKDAGISPKMKWKDAFKFCDELEAAGYDDWRLPTKAEMMTIVDDYNEFDNWIPLLTREGFKNFQKEYWTATPVADNPKRAWGVSIQGGLFDKYTKDVEGRMLWVLPVRAGRK